MDRQDPGHGAAGKIAPGGSTSQPPEPAFVRTRPDPAAVAEIRRHVGRSIAAGRLYSTDGKPLSPLVGPGDTGASDDLAEPRRSMRFVDHVESNATARMRRNKIRQAVFYSNMRPCTGDDGCTENVEATLPVGYKLTVYQVFANGGVKVWEFPGTGEGLADDERR